MSTVSGEASEAELDLSRTSDVENETGSKSVGPDDETEHPADKGHGMKVPNAWDAVMNQPSSEPESNIDVQGG